MEPEEDVILTAKFSAPRNRTRGCGEDYGPRQEAIGGPVVGQTWDDDRVDHGTLGLGTFEAGRGKRPSK